MPTRMFKTDIKNLEYSVEINDIGAITFSDSLLKEKKYENLM